MSNVKLPEIDEPDSGFKAPDSLLKSIVQSSEDAIITKDLNGIITSWNPAAERIFGYTPEEIVGKSVLMLIPPSLYDEEPVILTKLRAGERIDHFETVRVTKDGKQLNVSLTISPLKDASGKIVGASKILRDIGERKQMENSLLLAEKIAAVGRMAAAVAHEINNPLESVLNLIYLARTNASDADQVVDYLNLAEKELLRVSHIARQTLGYYREHSAAIPVTLSDLILDTLKVYESRLTAAGIEVRTEFSSNSQIVVRKGEMIQVISNFITNAIYAMPSGVH
jgi:PAS domain S-box-containing protein